MEIQQEFYFPLKRIMGNEELHGPLRGAHRTGGRGPLGAAAQLPRVSRTGGLNSYSETPRDSGALGTSGVLLGLPGTTHMCICILTHGYGFSRARTSCDPGF